MKILFFYMGAENLGIEYLSAAARRAGHEVELLYDPAVFHGHIMWDIPALARIFDLKNKMIKRAVEMKPDIAAFSCVTSNYQWALSIANEIRPLLPATKIIFGGPHVSAAPHAVAKNDCVDALIEGEADEEFPNLLRIIETGEGSPGPGSLLKRNGDILGGHGTAFVRNLDELPWPDKLLFFQKAPAMEEHYVTMTSRGCPFDCSYCYTKTGEEGPGGRKHRVRRRSVENVLAEFEERVSPKTKRIIFRDDIFATNHDWLRAFEGDYIRKVNRPYYCYAHPAMIDEEIADILKRTGCAICTMGVQSADDGQRRNMLNRRYTNDQVRRTVSLLKERGIPISLDHIMGIPGDTVKMIEEAALFYSELRPNRMFAFWLTYYPGTEMLKKAQELGLLSEEDVRGVDEGRIGYRFSGGGAKKVDPLFRKLAALISATPLLPRSLVTLLVSKKLYRFIPSRYGFINALISINALVKRDIFFMYALKTTLFSKKNVP